MPGAKEGIARITIEDAKEKEKQLVNCLHFLHDKFADLCHLPR